MSALSHIESLCAHYAAGDCERSDAATGRGATRSVLATKNNVYVRFPDGSIWFPRGVERATGSTALFPLLGGAFVLTLGGTIVGVADGMVKLWAPSLALLVLVAIAIWRMSAAETRKQHEAEQLLKVGLFLLDGALVLRDGSLDRVVEKRDIEKFGVHFQRRGGNKALDWIHVELQSGESVPTDLVLAKGMREVLRPWLGQPLDR